MGDLDSVIPVDGNGNSIQCIQNLDPESSHLSFQGVDPADGDKELLVYAEIDHKMQNEDYVGARALVEEANIKLKHEILVICDVLSAANMEFPGYGIDWYWVLKIFPTADSEVIEAQYRKLFTQVKIINGGFRSRESALKLIQTAYSVLSVPSHRASFNHKRDRAWKQLNVSRPDPEFDIEIGDEALDPLTGTITDANSPTSSVKPKVVATEAPSGVLQSFQSDPCKHEMKSSLSPIGSCSSNNGANLLHHISTNATSSVSLDKSKLNPQAKWSIGDIMVEQVWAVYDAGAFALPRFYAKVVNIDPPSIVTVTLLEPNPRLEEEIHWIEEGLPVACGVFRLARDTMNLELTRFSHVVKCELSSGRSFCRIFPRKGEIWALHKNWRSDWKPCDFSRSWYQVVEILSDFSNDECIKVCSLVEVDGYMTFFKRRLCEGSILVKKFPWSEMLSFSHQIPAYSIVGVEDQRIPIESWHLEPDALPLKLDSSCNVE